MKDQTKSRTLEVVQITDSHLFETPEGCLLGVNTEQSLRDVIDAVRTRSPQPELALATGDLVHDGSPAGYRRIRDHFERLEMPVFCIPGNHDEGPALKKNSPSEMIHCTGDAIYGNWLFVLLDSTVPGSEGGNLRKAELERLDATLSREQHSHALVCLHHQPVLIGSRWLDTMAVDNSDDFFAVIDRHPQVRGVLWGHVHQTHETTRGDVQLFSTPSTCVQFRPGSETFAIDPLPPGYRRLALHLDGTIETEVVRLAELPRGLDLASSGY